MKKLALLLALLFSSSQAWSASYYFDHASGSDSTGTGAIGSPYKTFKGTTLDNANALSCGDTINLKRGSTQIWEGSEAEIVIDSGTSSCSSNPIIVQSYGTGALPILAGASVTSAGWSLHATNIYKVAGQTQSYLKTVTQDDNKALGYWGGSNTTLPAGTFRWESPTLYVHLWSDANPTTSSVRIASFSHSSSADGARGLLSGSRNSARGHYVYFRDVTVLGANGVGFSVSGAGNKSANLNIIGAGADGLLCYSEITGSAESCTSYRDYYSSVSYSAAAVNGGGGYGQGVTNYGGPYNFWIGTTAHHNFMAGFDALNIGSNGTSIQGGFLRTQAYYNGIAQANPSYDSNYYCDGCSQWLFMGGSAYGGGLGSGTAGNARQNLLIGAEFPTTRPAHDVDVISMNLYGTNYLGFTVANPTSSGYATNKNMRFLYNTVITNVALGNDSNYFLDSTELDSTAGNIQVKGNIFVFDSQRSNDYMVNASNVVDDYNVFYKRATASTSTPVYSLNGGGTNYSVSGWNALNGNEANGVYGDPSITSDVDVNNDVHLGGGSSAINACTGLTYTPQSWLPSDIFPTAASKSIRGYTVAGSLDNVDTAPDCGFHYMYGLVTAPTVTPASLTASAVGSVAVQFTIPDSVIFYNGIIKVTFPSGFGLSSGGTSTVSGLSGITGTVTSGVSGQVLTITRVGDGNTEFPGTFGFNISNISNPSSSGATGTFKIQTYDSSSNLIAEETSVPAVTIASSGSGGGGGGYSGGVTLGV